ncbi:MAG: hypothetical protein AVDCRST_MAG49-3011, partial [uncultured Thermomicrobiales bacterium]
TSRRCVTRPTTPAETTGPLAKWG